MESKGPPSFFFCATVDHAQLSQTHHTHQASKQYNASGGGLRWLGGTPQLMLIESIQLSFPKKPSANATGRVPKPFRFQSKNQQVDWKTISKVA